MFSGIIEKTGIITAIEREDQNIHLWVQAQYEEPLYIDQSIAHNGVCLTVVDIKDDTYKVTAIAETLDRSNLGIMEVGSRINLERAVRGDTRMDGHNVQGHVDDTAKCIGVEHAGGSWVFSFQTNPDDEHLLVDKGSVAINGTSLTVISPEDGRFSVAIIPYTYEHTTFCDMKEGDTVNIEYDIVGKYVARYMKLHQG